jgi:hypothetical protein
MREKMEAMQQQIEEFVQTLNHELANRPMAPKLTTDKTSLIPVIRTLRRG